MSTTPPSRSHARWRVAAATALTILAASCGGQQEPAVSDREPRAGQPAASAAAPGGGPQPASRFDGAPRVLPEETAPTRYVLSGRGVDRATFASALARLVVARQPASSETVENPDGSYGGASGIYPALDPDGSRWTLTETTTVDGAAVTTTYELAPAP